MNYQERIYNILIEQEQVPSELTPQQKINRAAYTRTQRRGDPLQEPSKPWGKTTKNQHSRRILALKSRAAQRATGSPHGMTPDPIPPLR